MAEQMGAPENLETPENDLESCVICGDALDGIQETSCQMCLSLIHI